MKNKRVVNIANKNIDELLKLSSLVQIEPPGYLRQRILNKINKLGNKKYSVFNQLIEDIKLFFYRKKTPTLVFSLSLIIILFLSISVIAFLENRGRLNPYNVELATNTGTTEELNNPLTKPIPIQILSEDNFSTNKEVSLSINGNNVVNPKSKLELNNNYNVIKVNSGSVHIEIEKYGSIIAHENSSFTLDTLYNIENEKSDIYITLEKGELDFIPIIKDFLNCNYYVETPSAIVNVVGTIFNVEVFENDNTIIIVKEGNLLISSNIKWGSKISDEEIKVINNYVNKPVLLTAGNTEIFTMEDVIDWSEYINRNYKKLISKYNIK